MSLEVLQLARNSPFDQIRGRSAGEQAERAQGACSRRVWPEERLPHINKSAAMPKNGVAPLTLAGCEEGAHSSWTARQAMGRKHSAA